MPVRFNIYTDGDANISVTNNISNLHQVVQIDSYIIIGIVSIINCTYKGIFYLP